jgi:hypothetical protein
MHAIIAVIFMLVVFGIVSFVQNMAFTWSSRSRNSKDPNYHRYASWCSNGVYYLTNALLTLYIVRYQIWWMLVLQGFVYTVTTAEGSVLMMKWLLKKEAGKKKVGNQFDEADEATLRNMIVHYRQQADPAVLQEAIRG